MLKHVHGGRYTVQTAYGDEDCHMDSMKPYRPELSGKSIPFQYYQPSTIPEGDTWIVEKILKHRVSKGKTEWLVQWKGYSQPSWETADKFLGFMLKDWKEYNQKHDIAVKLSQLQLKTQTLLEQKQKVEFLKLADSRSVRVRKEGNVGCRDAKTSEKCEERKAECRRQ